MESFREFFENPDFRTDGLKLYPTLVIRGTGLYELWKKGLYKNYPPEKLIDLVARVLALVCTPFPPPAPAAPYCSHPMLLSRCNCGPTVAGTCSWLQVPPWVRVYRIQRDIPMPLVTSGVEKGNLRELALARMGKLGLQCRDVRTRECGIQDLHHKVRPPGAAIPRMLLLLCNHGGALIIHAHHPTGALPAVDRRSSRTRWSLCAETTQPMAGGRRSWHTRTLSKISSSGLSGCADAPAAWPTGSLN